MLRGFGADFLPLAGGVRRLRIEQVRRRATSEFHPPPLSPADHGEVSPSHINGPAGRWGIPGPLRKLAPAIQAECGTAICRSAQSHLPVSKSTAQESCVSVANVSDGMEVFDFFQLDGPEGRDRDVETSCSSQLSLPVIIAVKPPLHPPPA